MTFPVAESRSCRNGNSAVYVPEYDKMDKNLHSEEKFLSAVEILFFVWLPVRVVTLAQSSDKA